MLGVDPLFFTKRIKSRNHWRIYPSFARDTVFLDIETTGPSPWYDDISAVTLYDGVNVLYFVLHENMDDLPGVLDKYKVLVTYNGKQFDIPFIENYFSIKCNQAHIDLRFILADLGYRGGLKGCEKEAGIYRGSLDGVDGYTAVLLWKAFSKTGDKRYRDMLLAYNAADSINLEQLMIHAYNMHSELLPCGRVKKIAGKRPPTVPFKIVRKLLPGLYKKSNWE
jgi:uncharacterized protein YprB with RNaseH-like and TPR domain